MRDKTGKEKGEVINNAPEIDIKKCIYDYFLKRYKRNINVSYIKMILFFLIHFFQQGTATRRTRYSVVQECLVMRMCEFVCVRMCVRATSRVGFSITKRLPLKHL